jgi:hypothetical protein
MDFVRINKVGVELEGAWLTRPPNAAFTHDGSVSVPGLFDRVGEYVSAPIATWPDVITWVTETYPSKANDTCGMHVHTSFKSKRDYARLMTPEFWEYFTERITAWGRRVNLGLNHPFWRRLEGSNQYCHKRFQPDVQVTQRRKYYSERYTQLNYCFRIHGTIECRLFPVFKEARIAVSAINELLDIYETYLRDTTHIDVVERVDGLA